MQPEIAVYRNTSYPAVGWVGIFVIVVAVPAVALGAKLEWVAGLALVLGGGLLVLILFRVYAQPKVVADPSGITVVNPLGRKTVAWSDVDKAGADRMLYIIRRDGTRVTAWAVQAANAARMLGRRSFADAVAEDLNRRLVQSRGREWADEAQRFRPNSSDRKRQRIVAILFAVWVIGLAVVTIFNSR